MIFVIMIAFAIISYAVSSRFKSKVKKYSQDSLQVGLSGKEIAEKMLRDHDIMDVQVTCTKGKLDDHYDPAKKTVNLSPAVYEGRSVISAAIAAHECGHAVQHAHAYSMLQLRSALVPITKVSGTLMNIIVIGSLFFGYFLYSVFPIEAVLQIIVASYAFITLFSFVTLPVEFDASKRAMAWLNDKGVVQSYESDKAQDALKWAAMTYVVAALASLVTLLYYASLLLGRD